MVRHPALTIPPADSLLDVLTWRAEHQPDQLAYSFLRDGITSDPVLTYKDLNVKARSIAAFLLTRFAPGDCLLLVYPPGLEFVQAFWAALYAGLVAVPVPPPEAFRLKQSMARLQRIAEDACPAGALSTSQTCDLLRQQGVLSSSLRLENWTSFDEIVPGSGAPQVLPLPRPTALAYLQYTSGSTSTPKGVMVSHRNMTVQSRWITEAGSYDARSVTLSWMPHFHDYGLVKGIIQPLWIGRPAYLMSPLTFLKRPMRWLEAIQHYCVTHSGGPNFAYRHCVEAIPAEQRERLDLSGWNVASCGAEPIAADTIDRFTKAFAASGFRREAFSPAYGMAEFTLLISLKRQGQQPTVRTLDSAALEQGVVSDAKPDASVVRRVVGCGIPVGDTEVVIAHPDTRSRCAAQQIGEIWLAGSSTAQGYWNNAEETARTFGASLLDTGEGPFLRTGDLGFIKDGEVFVTGRLKDLLIIRGRNHYPQDIERTVEGAHALLRVGGAAVFSVQADGEEAVVVVQEVERQATALNIDEMAGAIRSMVSEQHDLHVFAVVFIKPGTLPKTSSGKVQRRACRALYMKGELPSLGESRLQSHRQPDSPSTAEKDRQVLPLDAWRQNVEQMIGEVIAKRLRCQPEAIPCDTAVNRLGLDSLMAAEVLHAIEEAWGVSLSMQILLGGASIKDLAATIDKAKGDRKTEGPVSAHSDSLEEHPGLLSENQAALWYLSRLAPNSSAANVSVLLHMPPELDTTLLKQALERLGDRHAALRTTYETVQDVPVQRVHDSLPLSWTVIDTSAWDWNQVRQQAVEASARPFDLVHGPVWRACLFQGSDQAWLLLVAHHIAVDG